MAYIWLTSEYEKTPNKLMTQITQWSGNTKLLSDPGIYFETNINLYIHKFALSDVADCLHVCMYIYGLPYNVGWNID